MKLQATAIKVCKQAGRMLKPLLAHTLYRPGTVATIFRGPSKGLRYHIYPGFGLAHLYNGWEPELLGLLDALVKPGMVCYDVGANYGLHALLMARRTGPEGKIFAFEPMPDIRAAAEKNRDLNGFAHLEVSPFALAESRGTAKFIVGHHEGAGHLSAVEADRGSQAKSGHEINVEVTTFDNFVAEGHPAPDLIKLDIEGAEGAALAGGRKMLATKRPKLLIELHTPEQDRIVGALLLEDGYRAFRIDEPGLPPVRDMTRGHPDPDGMRGHILAIHESQLDGGRPVF